ncbi:PERQ amino acid-rich with GYF domain-containing protein 2-like [Patagioenas fasciata monilis]|uniref:PERQ amino acid-rich with GYF domain-containing protein 2-like n=1 Tax=Patagioenas fasciata monilis TaxID=372326 RepID=A0A1V4KRN3_PATFA|nr:PERQ amino acid-rich with GYF domain-containing protein 2-like [Patagioenas fasciata monilis]
MLCVLFVIPELVVLFFLVAAVLYASCCDAEFLYHLLLRVLREETYYNMAYAVGRILTVISEGPLPF